jgi:cytochrome b6-f complex iron-sulfur subunit
LEKTRTLRVKNKKIRPAHRRNGRNKPEKSSSQHQPEKTLNSSAKKHDRMSRRDFFKFGISTLGALVMAEVGLVGFMYFRSRGKDGQVGGKITLGPVENFPPGSITEFSKEGFFLINTKEGELKALYRRCPHLGCNVEWVADKEQFYCPCHGSSFDAAGKFERPPVPRSLDVFPVSITKDVVIVDTSRPYREEDLNSS